MIYHRNYILTIGFIVLFILLLIFKNWDSNQGDQRENKEFKFAISNCENIIQLAKSIRKDEIVESYSKILIQTKKDLEFEKLKETVKKLNQEGLELLKKGEISFSLERFKKIEVSLTQFIE